MKKVLKFVKGKKDERKEWGGGITPSQSGDLISPAQTPEDERFLGLDNASGGYVVDFSGKDKSVTKLHKAAWQGNLDKLKSALKKVEINAADKENRTALHFAVAQGHPSIVWFLLGNNASTSIADDEGCTPLLKAVECRHKECLKLLLERGADVNAAEYTGQTGLHIAVRHGSTDIVSELLRHHANPDVSDSAGDYPLHMATKAENKDIVDLLLGAGAQVNVLDRENRTPLMLAAKNGNLLLANFLFECGAELGLVDSNGWTTEDYALLGGHDSVASLVKELTKSKETSSKEEIRESHEEPTSSNAPKAAKTCETWDDSQSDPSETTTDAVAKKVKEFFKSYQDDKSSESEKLDTVPDSPSVQSIPPLCQPPRSWDMIQAGMIDESKPGTEQKRLSLTTLGTLQSRRESFTEGLTATSPKGTHSLNRRKGAKVINTFAKQRLSFNEETSLRTWTSEDSRSKLEKVPKEDPLPEVEKSGSDGKGSSDVDSKSEKEKQDGTWEGSDKETLQEIEEIWVSNAQISPGDSRADPGDMPNSWDNSDTSTSGKDVNFPPPPSALELGVDLAKSMHFMRGMSIDQPAAVHRNLWKNTYETHSLDRLEEVDVPRADDLKNLSKHETTSSQRWISQEIPKCQKPVDRLRDVNRRINEQLQCYDQALRELAESSTVKNALNLTSEKISASHNYYSLPSSKIRSSNGDKKVLSDDAESRNDSIPPVSAPACVNTVKERTDEGNKRSDQIVPDTSDDQRTSIDSASGSVDGYDRKTKRHMLLAMRDVKHAVNATTAFKASTDDQILSPLTQPEGAFDMDEGGLMPSPKVSPDDNDDAITNKLYFGIGRQETVMERKDRRRKSSSSGTTDEPTLWLQDKKDPANAVLSPGSDVDVSDISDEQGPRSTAFSPLGVIHREIQRESQNEPQPEGETRVTGQQSSSILQGGLLNRLNCANEELKDVGRDQSPDISLSSGPIEPLGTEKDSGSEPESSHNDVTPTHDYPLKSHQEWLKSHLKTATTEKNKLEEVAAQLMEKAERLQYELADAKEATKSRDEVIKLLQEQLARMETAYTKSLEESVQSRLQLTSHEQEILHLKEICYKYEEERGKDMTEADAKHLEKMESQIKKLEGEKEKLREEILQLENDKSSLIKRLKELTESDIIDQCQRWKERCEKLERELRDGPVSPSERVGQTGNGREKELVERVRDLERKLSEVTEENADLSASLARLTGEIESERKLQSAKMEINDSIYELKRKNVEVEAHVKSLEKEVEDKTIRNLKERETEIQVLVKQFNEEKDALVKLYESRLTEQRQGDAGQLDNYRRENEALRQMMVKLQDQVAVVEAKFSMAAANESMRNDLFELRDQCEAMTKTFADLHTKDNQSVNLLLRENADIKTAINEIKVNMPRDDGRNLDFREKYLKFSCENAKMKNLISDLKTQVTSLTHLLGAKKSLIIGSPEKRKIVRDTDKMSIRRDSRRADCMAWSNLYGMKKSDRSRGQGSSFSEPHTAHRRLDSGDDGARTQATGGAENEKVRSLEKLELVKLKREIASLQNKMTNEKTLRQALESQINEISIDLRDKQTLEQEIHSLKRKINRDYTHKCDLELVKHQRELQEKREKYLDDVDTVTVADDSYKSRCEALAKEKEKSNEIRHRILDDGPSFRGDAGGRPGQPGPPLTQGPAPVAAAAALPSPRLGFASSLALTPAEPFASSPYGHLHRLTLEPEIKNQLEKELDKSIKRHKAGA